MAKVLLTSGAVYTHLDDNKILSNMARGKWITRFAEFLRERDHEVELLHGLEYGEYRRRCMELAPHMDAAVMAAAVINYMPVAPFRGKMPTNLDKIAVELIRTPYVIDEMRRINPRLKLIGCKLTSRESRDSTVVKAQQLIDRTRSHAVIANDRDNLKLKLLCFPDGAVLPFDDDFDGLYSELKSMIEDVHYSTTIVDHSLPADPGADRLMNALLDRYRSHFSQPWAGGFRNFGSVAVRRSDGLALMTPRVKGDLPIYASNCVTVEVMGRNVLASGKATMNAPLLWNVLKRNERAAAVVHVHTESSSFPVRRYAPPGTVRDSERTSSEASFHIQHHGIVACVNASGEMERDDV
jgi:phosphopantothenoylcysteine decarboxylase/phosphopantothenate--cysteine ligase